MENLKNEIVTWQTVFESLDFEFFLGQMIAAKET